MSDLNTLRIDGARLLQRLRDLGQCGALEGGGTNRLALSDADQAARDWTVQQMRDLGMEVQIDAIGNVVATYAGTEADALPVMTGSHIDTVRTGGLYDGNYGVMAGLEVVATLRDAGLRTRRPLQVAFFTNEEGARFQPDMLEQQGVDIGVVEGVQGICWMELHFQGTSNHAGTTPMALRHDAGMCAMRVAAFVADLVQRYGGRQLGTVGAVQLKPNLINVIASEALMTVDMRNTDGQRLRDAQAEVLAFARGLAAQQGVQFSHRQLADFEPVAFDAQLVHRVEQHAQALGLSTLRMPSGAGHDAQMLARICPTAMVFVPSAQGLSHNVREHTDAHQLEQGANVLLQVLLEAANS